MSGPAPLRPVQSTALDFEVGTFQVAGDEKGRKKTYLRQTFGWLLRLLLGAAAFAYVLHFIDFREVWQRISSANISYLYLAFVLSVLQYAVFGIRWRWLAECVKAQLPMSAAVVGNLELAFFTQIVPTALAGDAVRIIRARRAGLTLQQSIASVMLDRVIGLATVVFLTPVLLMVAPGELDQWLRLVVVLLPCAFIVGLLFLYFMSPLLAALLPDNRVVSLCISISEAFRALTANLPILALAVLVSVGGNVLAAAALSLVGYAIGLPLGVTLAIPIICLMTLAVFIPVSIGGWGVREGAAVAILGAFAVSAKDAVALSVLYGVVGTAVGIVGGVVWVTFGYGRLRDK